MPRTRSQDRDPAQQSTSQPMLSVSKATATQAQTPAPKGKPGRKSAATRGKRQATPAASEDDAATLAPKTSTRGAAAQKKDKVDKDKADKDKADKDKVDKDKTATIPAEPEKESKRASATPAPRRRGLRSAKANNSPLQVLEAEATPAKKRRTTKKEPTLDKESEQTIPTETEQSESEATGAFFEQRNQHLFRNQQLEIFSKFVGINPTDAYELKPETMKDMINQRTEEEYLQQQEEQEDKHVHRPFEVSPVKGGEGHALLMRVMKKAQTPSSVRVQETQNDDAEDVSSTDSEAGDVPMADALDQNSTATKPIEQAEASTPRSSGWRIGSIVKRIFSPFQSSSPFSSPVVPPATAPPSMLAPDDAANLVNTLTPSKPPRIRPTKQVKTRKSTDATSQPKRKLKTTASREVFKQVVSSVRTEEKDKAKRWVIAALETIDDNQQTVGKKRKHVLEKPVKMSELASIPAREPWQPEGSFGLLPDFFDISDEEDVEVPAWAKLQDAERKAKERASGKRRKTMHNDAGHGNILQQTQQDQDEDAQRSAFEKEQRCTGHVEGTGTFRVPDDSDSDGDSSMVDADNASPSTPTPLWTQHPPPAPTPAHASLPGAAPSAPTVPAVIDPAQAQRSLALKYAPKAPSRLRNAEIPSPMANTELAKPLSEPTDTPAANFNSVLFPGVVEFEYPGGIRPKAELIGQVVDMYGAGGIEVVEGSCSEEDPVDFLFPDGEESLLPEELDQEIGVYMETRV
ncbi:hypothetical protein GQ43DRAFT_480005 [Delitschia confertaspora ATCC 74209]|uniref:Uncharacterized protein n=1 Tax=Delitschia confertaspora ATCC 74209 TaxID=1513339 RepID=A0A9P4JQ05_9PLEO|nr:hypothetical protein GQ43DRAFT_480005 [Delitschia confertaspora ATCC 74209]